MRLTIEKDGESLRRYAHVKPARGWRVRRCSAPCPGTSRRCSLSRSHRGPHVAHGLLGRVVAVWDMAAGVQGSPQTTRRALEAMEGRDLSRRGIVGGFRSLWGRLTNLPSYLGEISMLALFLGFVALVVTWLRMIFLG